MIVLQLALNGISTDLRHIVHFESLSAALRHGLENITNRRVPLTHLQLQRCPALDMDALQLLLDAVPTLQSLDISRGMNIDDTAVKTLAQYEPGPFDDAVHVVLESLQLEVRESVHHVFLVPGCVLKDVLMQHVSFVYFVTVASQPVELAI